MNMADILARRARLSPQAVAVAVGEAPLYTYARLAAAARSMAHGLRTRHGLAPGERVALAMRNCPEFLLALFAIWHAGLCAVPMNFRLHRHEFAYMLGHSGARLCLVSPDLGPTLAGLEHEVAALELVLGCDDPRFPALCAGEDGPDCAGTAADAPAWLFYTSGTTGRPKGAVLSHRNLAFMTQAYFADIDGIGIGIGDTMLLPAALSHGAGLYMLPGILQGACHVICEQPSFDPAEILHLVRRYPHVSMFAAPTMLKRLALAAGDADTRKLRTIVYGGGPMYEADLAHALEVLGPCLAQIYGQGESPMTITALAKSDHGPARLGTCGLARSFVDVRVVDDAGRSLPPGELGEIVTRSDCVMQGYWQDPRASAQALHEGWLHTGDLGRLDEAGYLTLKDRAKDMIISGGSNVYPREIEEVLLTHAQVAEAAVVGRPHFDWGEEVVAFVVARPGPPPDAAALDAWCLRHVARYKRPRQYRFVDELPKNNYGKVLKTELRRQLRGEDDG